MNWFVHCMRHYATFKGRAARPEYWWFWFCTVVGSNGLTYLVNALNRSAGAVVGWAISLVILLPTLAVSSRRLHDTGHSFWWVALVYVGIAILAIVGSFPREQWPPEHHPFWTGIVFGMLAWSILTAATIVFMLKRGDAGPNRYGGVPPLTPG